MEKPITKIINVSAAAPRPPTSDDMLQLLRNFGWGSGFRSAFADTENQRLETLLEKKQTSNLALRAELEDTLAHEKDLNRHLLESGQDIRFTESLINTKKLECDNEKNMYLLSQRVHSHFVSEIHNQKVELKNYRDRNILQYARAHHRKEIIDELTHTVQTDMVLLKILEEKKREYEDHVDNVHKYSKIDQKNIHELEAKQVELGARNKILRHELDQCAMNSTKCNEQYSRLCAEFRKKYKQKKEMIVLWAKSLAVMKGRDSEMREIADEFHEVRARIRRARSFFEGRNAVLNQKKEDLREADCMLDTLDRKLKEIREKLEKARAVLLINKNEYSQYRIIIQNTSLSVESCRQAKRNMEAQVAVAEERLKVIEQVVRTLRLKRDEVISAGLSKEGLLDELDRLIDNEERIRIQKEREVDRIRNFAFNKSNERADIIRETQRRETRASRIRSTLSILEQKEFETMEILAKKQSKMYRMDLDVSQTEMRISKLMTHNIDPRFFKLQERVIVLREKDEVLRYEQREITKEIERVVDLTHAFNRDIDGCIHEKELLEAALFDITLNSQKMEKALGDSLANLRILRIEHSMDIVARDRVRKNVTRYQNIIFSLAQHRATVEAAVKERKSEIGYLKTLIFKQNKELTRQIRTLCTERVDLDKYIRKLKGRYQLTTSLMQPSSEADGRGFSFAKAIHAQVRVREQLNAQRDAWDFRNQEAARELEGLKNALQVVAASNVAFRQSLVPATDKNNMADHVHENEKKAMVIRNRCKVSKSKLQTQTQALLKQLGVYKQQVRNCSTIATEKERDSSSAVADLKLQHDRIKRWETLICRQTKVLIKNCDDPEFMYALGKELKRRMITEKFNHAINKLRSLVHNRPALADFIYRYADGCSELFEVVNRIRFNRSQATVGRRSPTSTNKSELSDASVNTSKSKVRSGLQFDTLAHSSANIPVTEMEHSETELTNKSTSSVSILPKPEAGTPKTQSKTEVTGKVIKLNLPEPTPATSTDRRLSRSKQDPGNSRRKTSSKDKPSPPIPFKKQSKP